MKIDKKSEFAVCAMINLGSMGKKAPVTVSDLARTQGISMSYMEQIFAKLNKAKLVKSVRGPKGGYQVADIDNVSFADIAIAITGVDPRLPSNRKPHQLKWAEISERIKNDLDNVKIRDYLY